MAKLTAEEKSRWQKELCVVQPPDKFLSRVTEMMEEVGDKELFKQGGLQFLLDASIAGYFAKGVDAETVQLIDDEWPDFRILSNGKPRNFESTEVDIRGRKRGDEYKAAPPPASEVPIGEYRGEYLDWIEKAVSAKARKNYDSTSNCSLMIYLNFQIGIVDPKEMRSECQAVTKDARNIFDEIWLLHGTTPIKIWP